MLSEEVKQFEKLSGLNADDYSVTQIGMYLDGYEKGLNSRRTSIDTISKIRAMEMFCADCRGIIPEKCIYFERCNTLRVLREVPFSEPEITFKDVADYCEHRDMRVISNEMLKWTCLGGEGND